MTVNIRLATLAAAFLLVAFGIVLYLRSADNFTACKSTIGGIVQSLDPASARDCGDAKTEHYAGIAIMILGGVALLAGSIPVKKPA